MDEKRSLQRKIIARGKLVARIYNCAALRKKECQDDLRTATRTIAKRVENCTEVDGGVFEK